MTAVSSAANSPPAVSDAPADEESDPTAPDAYNNPAARRHTRVLAAKAWRFPDLQELWYFRELLLTLAGRDLKVRYKQTALGIVWIVFQPLAAALIFTAVRGFFGLPSPGMAPEILFVLAGYVGWNLIKDVLERASGSMLGNAHLVSKIYFPRTLLPLGTTISVIFDYAVMLLMVAIVWIGCAVAYGPMGLGDPAVIVPGLGWHLLLWPVATVLMILLALGIGMAATALASHYRDIKHIIPVMLQLAFFASPVFYDLSQPINEETVGWFHWAYLANPVAGLLPVYRWSLIGVGEVHWGAFAYAAVLSVVVLLVGSLIFRRVEGGVADVI